MIRSMVTLLAAALTSQITIATAAEKPNILYIVADDIGWKDVGFHNAADIKTPVLDKLAAEGARLEAFYTQPFCTPTRAALLTGRYPFRYGLQTVVIPSKGQYGLDMDERTMPEVLKEAGYSTIMVGKWHLGHADRKYWPRQRGFDYHYGALIGEIDYFTRESHGVIDWQRNNVIVREKGYVTQLLGADAVKQIEKHDGKKPMFMYLAFTAAHSPYQAPKEYLDKYSGIEEPTRRAYAGQITCMDDEIGKVLAALDKKKMRENTLIVFHSDNGGTKSKMFVGEGSVSKIPCDNGELNGGKGQLYEGGTRVPAFVNWPGRVKAGEVKAPIHVTDMLPTLAKLAGASTEKCKPLDGVDAWPAISEGKETSRKEVVYNVEPFAGAVRQGDWKLVVKAVLPSKVELFNISADPNEKDNLAEKEPAKVKELMDRLQKLAGESKPPYFLQETLKAIYGGLMGPAPIPQDEPPATTEP